MGEWKEEKAPVVLNNRRAVRGAGMGRGGGVEGGKSSSSS